jgi:integrase
MSDSVNGTRMKPIRLEKGLMLEMRPRKTTYSARAYFKGKEHYHPCETADIDRASRDARSWFSRLKSDHIPGSSAHVTMHEAAKSFIRSIRNAKRRDNHQTKWDGMSQLFTATDVDAVDSPFLMTVVERLRDREIKENSVHKYLVTCRRILKHSIGKGWIKTMPLFPDLEKIESNPRPWLEPHEWKKLQEEAEERVEIAKDEPGKHRHSRQDLLDFMRLQVATCMRVDELRNVKVSDVQILTKVDKQAQAWQREEARLERREEVIRKKSRANQRLTAAFMEHVPTFEYLQIRVNGKTGERMAVTRRTDSGVDVFRALVKRKNLKPEDLLFTEHHRDAFRELLIHTDLRENRSGIKRNLKSLRCTGIMLWVLENPNVNLKLLASSCGTSVTMLDQFYLKPLNVQLRRDELVG